MWPALAKCSEKKNKFITLFIKSVTHNLDGQLDYLLMRNDIQSNKYLAGTLKNLQRTDQDTNTQAENSSLNILLGPATYK